MRLNKYIAQAGLASRRQADKLIAEGSVKVNGQLVDTMGLDVGEDDTVEVNGSPVSPPEPAIVYLLHKPKGYISAAADDRGRSTVIDLIRDGRRLYPVGRLDRDTTGALLITNRGDLTFKLTHPKFGIEKRYLADVTGRLPKGAEDDMRKGMLLKDGMRIRANVTKLDRHGPKTLYEVLLTEGKNREIKRIFSHFELPLNQLHRTHFAGLHVESLAEGKYRKLRPNEVAALNDAVATEKGSRRG